MCFQDADGFPIDIQITDNRDGTFCCVYVPSKPIKHTIIITWGDVNVPSSPFRVISTHTDPMVSRSGGLGFRLTLDRTFSPSWNSWLLKAVVNEVFLHHVLISCVCLVIR